MRYSSQLAALVSAFILVSAAPSEAASKTAIRWKARAVKADEYLKHVAITGKSDIEEVFDAKLLRLIEFAYSLHGAHEELVHKVETDGEAFHIVLNLGTGDMFDLVYTYKNDQPVAVRIDKLPTGWGVMLMAADPKHIIVMPNADTSLVFSIDDPLNAIALGDTPAAPTTSEVPAKAPKRGTK